MIDLLTIVSICVGLLVACIAAAFAIKRHLRRRLEPERELVAMVLSDEAIDAPPVVEVAPREQQRR